MHRTSWIWASVLAALAAAPSALADGRPAAPGAVPDASVAVRTERWNTPAAPAPTADAVLVGGPVAQDPKPCGPCRLGYDDCGNKRWSGNVWFGGWLWAQTGTVGILDRDVDVDTTLSDSFDLFKDYGERALTGGGRVNYGRCFAQAWVSFLRISGEKDHLVTGEPIEATLDGTTAQLVAGYRVNEITLGCSPCSPCLAFEPYAGVRYNSLELEIEGTQTTTNRDKDWWDPIVGCNFQLDFRNRWYASLAVDVGGFGVGSDFTWSMRADVGYMFTEHFGVFTGLLAIDWDYEDGGFKYDLTQWGPYIGLVFTF